MNLLITLGVITAIALLWSLIGRDWLKAQGWAWSNAFFAWIEPVEITLWKNSKTIFIARLKMLNGLLLTLATQLGSIDITPLMPFVPEGWRGTISIIWNMLPLVITLMGWMDEHLRNETTKPLEQVALPEAIPAEVAAVVAKAEVANAKATVVINEAKAEGKL